MPATEILARVEVSGSHSGLDDEHYEIINGQVVETPRLSAYETWLASFLIARLAIAARGVGRVVSEMMFALGPNSDARRPDVAFVSYKSWARNCRVPSDAAWNVVPELAIEVVSPSNSASAVMAKIEEYFQAGVKLIWVIYPYEQVIQVWNSATGCQALRPGEFLEGGDVLPAFRLAVAELFDVEAEAVP